MISLQQRWLGNDTVITLVLAQRKCMHKHILVGLAAQTRCNRPTYVKQTTGKSLNLPPAEDQCNTCEHLVPTPEAPAVSKCVLIVLIRAAKRDATASHVAHTHLSMSTYCLDHKRTHTSYKYTE